MKTAEGFLSRIKKKGKFLLYFLLHYKKYTEERSFYPEKEHKSKSQIFRDFLFHILKYGEIDYTYYVLGIDVKGIKYDGYISYHQFMVRRDRLNMIRRDRNDNAEPANYACILRDKAMFSIFATYWGFPVVNDLAKMVNKRMIESEYDSIEDLLNANHHVFIKPVDGQKGENVFGVNVSDNEVYINGNRSSMSEVVSVIEEVSVSHDMLFQMKIIQHPDVSVFHKESVNTLRVVTINHLHSSNPDDVVLVGSELRVGCGGNHTDNVSAGGLKIGVNENGTLMEYGFYDKEHGTKTSVHPDSGIVFQGYLLPFYNETIQLCKEFHAKLKEIHFIGWDVAITKDGPVFVEGNESCGTDFQVMFGPMKDFYDKYLPYHNKTNVYSYKS
jgi:hypothetical protein